MFFVFWGAWVPPREGKSTARFFFVDFVLSFLGEGGLGAVPRRKNARGFSGFQKKVIAAPKGKQNRALFLFCLVRPPRATLPEQHPMFECAANANGTLANHRPEHVESSSRFHCEGKRAVGTEGQYHGNNRARGAMQRRIHGHA